MCICNNHYPQTRIDFNDTILYGARVRNPQGQVEHILAYYNKVQAVAGTATNSEFGWETKPAAGDDFGWDIAPEQKVGNAMLFALPIKPGSTLTPANLIPVKDYPHFMEDYKKAVAPRTQRRALLSADASFSLSAKSIETVVVKGFDGGVYDVVIAPRASAIIDVLNQLDDDKRPQINAALYAELDTVYPNFAFVLFCFSEADAERAGCAAIRYTPLRDDIIFLPGLDGHNGTIERGMVERKHTLVVGTFDMSESVGRRADLTDLIPASGPATVVRHPEPAPYWMLERVIGKILEEGTETPQGDFLIDAKAAKKGKLRCRVQVGPGWKNLSGNPADPAGATPYYIGD